VLIVCGTKAGIVMTEDMFEGAVQHGRPDVEEGLHRHPVPPHLPAWCTDQVRSGSNPHSRSGSGKADIARAPQLQHTVEGMHSYVNFGHTTFVKTRV
jgi:hypothetical protein